MDFSDQLAVGQVGESEISRWLISRGNHVLPVYETEQEYKGPRVFTSAGDLVATDMFVFREGVAMWIEAKTKSAFTWHRNTGRWTTGIDLHHYNDYLKIRQLSGFPVYLLFLHRSLVCAKDSPKGPAGLYGGELLYLARHENHRSPNWGRHGMVYWAENVLGKYAGIEEFEWT